MCVGGNYFTNNSSYHGLLVAMMKIVFIQTTIQLIAESFLNLKYST